MSFHRPYPVIITQARYGGTYEGGPWVGFVAEHLPEEAFGSDPECMSWWFKWGGSPAVAASETPDHVFQKLQNQNAEQFPPLLDTEAFEVSE